MQTSGRPRAASIACARAIRMQLQRRTAPASTSCARPPKPAQPGRAAAASGAAASARSKGDQLAVLASLRVAVTRTRCSSSPAGPAAGRNGRPGAAARGDPAIDSNRPVWGPAGALCRAEFPRTCMLAPITREGRQSTACSSVQGRAAPGVHQFTRPAFHRRASPSGVHPDCTALEVHRVHYGGESSDYTPDGVRTTRSRCPRGGPAGIARVSLATTQPP